MKPKNICRRCKNKEPNFADYLSETFDLDLKKDNYKYYYCKSCGQFYRKKVPEDSFRWWNLPVNEALFIIMLFVLLFQPIVNDITEAERTVLTFSVISGSIILTIWLHYICTKFSRINMKALDKYLKSDNEKISRSYKEKK